ncbi:hypothetical protein [Natronospira sp.]|uniref:hypothetical protein n=1 Tax=Natronospira sp. TaxID=2024970 RepID=UPI0038737126
MRKRLHVIRSKTQVQYWTTLVIFGIIFAFTACSKDSVSIEEPPKEPPEEYPTLKIVNQVTDNRYISSVELVGYEFNNLNITSDNSQTFALDSGMPGGYENINIIVSYRTSTTPTNSRNTTVNFKYGEITTITLKGCISYEGCDGHFLE